jgi:hypothetical protein
MLTVLTVILWTWLIVMGCALAFVVLTLVAGVFAWPFLDDDTPAKPPRLRYPARPVPKRDARGRPLHLFSSGAVKP